MKQLKFPLFIPQKKETRWLPPPSSDLLLLNSKNMENSRRRWWRESIQILISTCISRSHPCCSLYCILSVMTYVSHLRNSRERKCRQCCQVFVNFKFSLFNIFWWVFPWCTTHTGDGIKSRWISGRRRDVDFYLTTMKMFEILDCAAAIHLVQTMVGAAWSKKLRKQIQIFTFGSAWILRDFSVRTEKRRFIRDNRSNFTRLLAPILDFHPILLSNFIKELRFYGWAVKKSTKQQSTQRAENDTKKCYDLLRNFMIFKLTKFLTLASSSPGILNVSWHSNSPFCSWWW